MLATASLQALVVRTAAHGTRMLSAEAGSRAALVQASSCTCCRALERSKFLRETLLILLAVATTRATSQVSRV